MIIQVSSSMTKAVRDRGSVDTIDICFTKKSPTLYKESIAIEPRKHMRSRRRLCSVYARRLLLQYLGIFIKHERSDKSCAVTRPASPN
jgi:hypothetical protein